MLLRSIPRLLSCQFGRKYHSMASPLPKLAVFEAISNHEPRSTAIVHASSGQRFVYGELLRDVADASSKLLQSVSDNNLDGQRVAFLTENSYDYVGMIVYVALDNSSQHTKRERQSRFFQFLVAMPLPYPLRPVSPPVNCDTSSKTARHPFSSHPPRMKRKPKD